MHPAQPTLPPRRRPLRLLPRMSSRRTVYLAWASGSVSWIMCLCRAFVGKASELLWCMYVLYVVRAAGCVEVSQCETPVPMIRRGPCGRRQGEFVSISGVAKILKIGPCSDNFVCRSEIDSKVCFHR